jgi:hypothetical protein
MLRGILYTEEVAGVRRKRCNEEVPNLQLTPNIITLIKSRIE